MSQKSQKFKIKQSGKWQCGNVYCKGFFDNQMELEYHQLAQHKTKLSECKQRQCNNSYIEGKRKRKPIKDVLKNFFTSEQKKLDRESPPVQNIRFK